MKLTAKWRRLGGLLVVAAMLLAGLSALPARQPAQASGVDAGATQPQQGNCQHDWFFRNVRPVTACPTGPAIGSEVAYLEFERGTMFWVAMEDAIYVLYRDWQTPSWERYPDTWQESMPERDPSIVGPLGLWQQPRRGFGQLWRTNPQVRQRLGWALYEWEATYTTLIQRANTPEGPLVFFTDEDYKVYQLPAGAATGWDRFSFLG